MCQTGVARVAQLPRTRVVRAKAAAAELDRAPDVSSPQAPPTAAGALELLLSAAAATAYTLLQARAATPDGGLAEATPAFYSEVSLLLPAYSSAAYLAFCALGPRVMAHRRPLACRAAMLVYNAYQALFNAACVAVMAWEVRRNGLRVWANAGGSEWQHEARYGRIAAVIWLHYNNKVRTCALCDDRELVARTHTTQRAATPAARRAPAHARQKGAQHRATARRQWRVPSALPDARM